MSPWAKTSIIGAATVATSVGFTGLFLHPDAFGGALLIFALVPTVVVQAAAIVSAWLWYRYTAREKKRFFASAAFGTCIAVALVFLIARVAFGREWLGFLRFLWPMPLLFCGVPLVYLCFCEPGPSAMKKNA